MAPRAALTGARGFGRACAAWFIGERGWRRTRGAGAHGGFAATRERRHNAGPRLRG